MQFKHMLSVLLLLVAGSAFALPPMNLPYGVTPISQGIYDLHMLVIYVCAGIGVVVFGVLFYSIFKYRRSKGAVAVPFHEHVGVEIVWTVIPFVILFFLAIPAIHLLYKIHDTSKPDITLKVVGYQWKWYYDYMDYGVHFFSNMSTPQADIDGDTPKSDNYLLEVDNPVVVPVQEKVRLLITSNDVIHSWWVPELGVKQDAIPGYINENWFYIEKPGVYRGQCAELCGAFHAFMPIVVKAVSKEEFQKWLLTQKAGQAGAVATAPNKTPEILTEQTLISQGEQAFNKTCAMCHQQTGVGMPPTFPALKGSAVVTGPTDAYIKKVLFGVPGTAMAAFGQQLDDNTIASILTYVRHSWGNAELTTKNQQALVIQPADVQKLRNAS